MKEFLVKATREAKVHSSWIQPNEAYESAVVPFTEAILKPYEQGGFLESFLELQRQIEFFAALTSLTQLLSKLTSPAAPPFSQASTHCHLNPATPTTPP